MAAQSNELFEVTKNVNSIKSRAAQVAKIDSESVSQSYQKDLFWQNQQKEMLRVMDALRYDVSDVRKLIKNNVLSTEKLIIEFRTKVKQEQFESLKNKVDKWRLEEYVTRKRLLELIEKETTL